MKTKNLLLIAAITLAAGLAAPARAGVSVNISFGGPVRYSPAVVIAPAPCLPPVVMCPPVVYHPAPVVVYRPVPPPPYRPVVYVAPRYDYRHDHRDNRDHRYHRGGESHGRGSRDDRR